MTTQSPPIGGTYPPQNLPELVELSPFRARLDLLDDLGNPLQLRPARETQAQNRAEIPIKWGRLTRLFRVLFS